jgi:hypothetical protein
MLLLQSEQLLCAGTVPARLIAFVATYDDHHSITAIDARSSDAGDRQSKVQQQMNSSHASSLQVCNISKLSLCAVAAQAAPSSGRHLASSFQHQQIRQQQIVSHALPLPRMVFANRDARR